MVARTLRVVFFIAGVLVAAPVMAGMWQPGVEAELAHFKLSVDLLDRITAVTSEAKEKGLDSGGENINIEKAPSIEVLESALRKHPKIIALLKKHNISARDYFAGTMVLWETIIAEKMKKNPAAAKFVAKLQVSKENAAFYRQHEARIEKFMALSGVQDSAGANSGVSTAVEEHSLKELRDFKKMDKKMFSECARVQLSVMPMLATLGLSAGPSHYPGGESIASAIRDMKKVLFQVADSVPQNDLKGYLTVMGEEVGKQHGTGIEVTPALKEALSKYNTWMERHCTRQALMK